MQLYRVSGETVSRSSSNFKLQIEAKSEVDVDWRRNWISSLYLSVQSGTVELQEEYLVYDFQVDSYNVIYNISYNII